MHLASGQPTRAAQTCRNHASKGLSSSTCFRNRSRRSEFCMVVHCRSQLLVYKSRLDLPPVNLRCRSTCPWEGILLHQKMKQHHRRHPTELHCLPKPLDNRYAMPLDPSHLPLPLQRTAFGAPGSDQCTLRAQQAQPCQAQCQSDSPDSLPAEVARHSRASR